MRNRMQAQHEEGFTLILVAVLLVVAAMAAATALQKSNRDTFWDAKIETREKIEKVVAALEAYQRENKVLPCVASRTAAQGDADHGTVLSEADCTGAAVTGGTVRAVTSEVVRIGAVPYKDLQLQDNVQEDGWGNKLLYAVSEDLTNPALYMSEAGILIIRDAGGTTTDSNAAFVVLSHGPDGIGAYRNKTGALVESCSATAGKGQENCNGDRRFREQLLNTTTGTSFNDDQVVWRPVDSVAQASE